MDWYYLKDDRRFGPVPETSIRAWMESGFLKPHELVWRSGMADWARVDEVPELSSGSRLPGGSFTQGTGLPMAPTPPEGSSGYAGFWLRAGAYLIDTLILSMVLLIFWRPEVQPDMTPERMMESIRQLQSNPGLMAAQLILSWLYFALLECSSWQATLGKKAFRLKVTDMEGRRLSFYRATVRHMGKILSQFTFLLGFVLAAFTPRKQALHDLLAKCLVVRR